MRSLLYWQFSICSAKYLLVCYPDFDLSNMKISEETPNPQTVSLLNKVPRVPHTRVPECPIAQVPECPSAELL